jgi:hypothetical protein
MTYPDISVMRRDISKVYDGPNWKAKVKYMPDGQVFAIWNKFCDEGKFKKEPGVRTSRTSESDALHGKTIHKPEEKRVDPVVVNEDYYCEQLAFDL